MLSLQKRRVVVTGMGVLSPAGHDLNSVFESVAFGSSWVCDNLKFDTSRLKSRVAATIPEKVLNDPSFENILSFKERKRISDFIYYGIIASHNAFQDASFPDGYVSSVASQFGTYITSGVGGIDVIADTANSVRAFEPKRISPFALPALLINLLPGNIAIKFGLKGPSISHVSACSSSGHSIGEAFLAISNGQMDYCLAGGAEAAICDVGVASFDVMGTLSSNFNHDPKKASRPLDKNRDGFVISEGAAVLVLESLDSALARGAKVYAEVTGYAATCDANHITAPCSSGLSVKNAMLGAIQMAGLSVKDVDYINLHGTSTPVGDMIELSAVRDLFFAQNPNVAISSTKSVTGHMLGATSAMEAVLTILSMQKGVSLPNINLDDPEDLCKDMNIITKSAPIYIKHALSNSFGFGGTNVSLLFSRFEG
jgi:3-oxoacyl-[acyl-carrier-protein] synthase II